MKLNIEIKIDNAAFGDTDDECEQELERVLQEVIKKLERDGPPELDEVRNLYDVNGNHVGICWMAD